MFLWCLQRRCSGGKVRLAPKGHQADAQGTAYPSLRMTPTTRPWTITFAAAV